MKGRGVVKFGGADLSTGEKIRRAAEMVANSRFKEIVVVVSAMGKTTDKLISSITSIGKVDDADYADIVSMGERTSARLFSAALKSLGVDSVYFDPGMEEWPIITDSNFKSATPDLDETRKRVKQFIEPLLEHKIPVVCGFLGRNKEGRVTTLGRGGSDTTAVLLGNCLEAEEVILVKETEGVLSADPKVVSTAKPIDRLDIAEMFTLALGGAKIVRPESLRYKLPNQRLKIINFASNNLHSEGTEIVGVFNSKSIKNEKTKGLSAITVLSDINPESLGLLFKEFSGVQILGISTGRNTLTVFFRSGKPEDVLRRVHDLGIFKSVSLMRGIGMIGLSHPSFIDSPGWVAKISSALASRKINIIEVTSSKSTINLFVNEEVIEEVSSAIGDLVEV